MALVGTPWRPCIEAVELQYCSFNSSTRLIRPDIVPLVGKNGYSICKSRSRTRCTLSKEAVSTIESESNAETSSSDIMEDELGHVMKFTMSDFKIFDQVSIGLGGRGDEVIFEAIVKEVNSPLYNTRVVLRRLTSSQAQRRGKRAIEVLKKLARRRIMYLSYSMHVHGYTTSDDGSFTLVHGYHGSFSLRHWLQQSDWLPTLEATLALDEECVRRVGDDTVGGPAISRQLRLIRILLRDLLIGVNYLHSHGLAHTELRLENLHISPVDRHIKVGILGNAVDFYDGPNDSTLDSGNMDRRKMMIAFDMRCVGFIMAKMVLQELMDPLFFAEFKTFLTKGNDPSCLREFLLDNLTRNSSSGNTGLQILDRNWGAGWNLMSLLLATKPSNRISCLDALRHPFLCGPRWRVDPSMDFIRWSLGSTAVRITEEYIYRRQQRDRIAHFIELMEIFNPHSKPKNWLELLPGKWRLLYNTGRHIGLTLRQPPARVLIGDVHLTVLRPSKSNTALSFTSNIGFTILIGKNWPHDKTGVVGELTAAATFRLTAGRRSYPKGKTGISPAASSTAQDSAFKKLTSEKWRRVIPFKDSPPESLRVAKLVSSDVDFAVSLGEPLGTSVNSAQDAVREIQTQVPPEIFDLSKIVCGTYVDPRLLVLRGVNGSALLFTRSV